MSKSLNDLIHQTDMYEDDINREFPDQKVIFISPGEYTVMKRKAGNFPLMETLNRRNGIMIMTNSMVHFRFKRSSFEGISSTVESLFATIIAIIVIGGLLFLSIMMPLILIIIIPFAIGIIFFIYYKWKMSRSYEFHSLWDEVDAIEVISNSRYHFSKPIIEITTGKEVHRFYSIKMFSEDLMNIIQNDLLL